MPIAHEQNFTSIISLHFFPSTVEEEHVSGGTAGSALWSNDRVIIIFDLVSSAIEWSPFHVLQTQSAKVSFWAKEIMAVTTSSYWGLGREFQAYTSWMGCCVASIDTPEKVFWDRNGRVSLSVWHCLSAMKLVSMTANGLKCPLWVKTDQGWIQSCRILGTGVDLTHRIGKFW